MTSEQVWGEHAAEIYKCFVGRRPGLMPVYTKQIYFLTAPASAMPEAAVPLYCKLIRINGEMVDFEVVLLVRP